MLLLLPCFGSGLCSTSLLLGGAARPPVSLGDVTFLSHLGCCFSPPALWVELLSLSSFFCEYCFPPPPLGAAVPPPFEWNKTNVTEIFWIERNSINWEIQLTWILFDWSENEYSEVTWKEGDFSGQCVGRVPALPFFQLPLQKKSIEEQLFWFIEKNEKKADTRKNANKTKEKRLSEKTEKNVQTFLAQAVTMIFDKYFSLRLVGQQWKILLLLLKNDCKCKFNLRIIVFCCPDPVLGKKQWNYWGFGPPGRALAQSFLKAEGERPRTPKDKLKNGRAANGIWTPDIALCGSRLTDNSSAFSCRNVVLRHRGSSLLIFHVLNSWCNLLLFFRPSFFWCIFWWRREEKLFCGPVLKAVESSIVPLFFCI